MKYNSAEELLTECLGLHDECEFVIIRAPHGFSDLVGLSCIFNTSNAEFVCYRDGERVGFLPLYKTILGGYALIPKDDVSDSLIKKHKLMSELTDAAAKSFDEMKVK